MFVFKVNRERILKVGWHAVPTSVNQAMAEAADPEQEAGIDLLTWPKLVKFLEEQLD